MQAFHAVAYDLSDQNSLETVMDLDELNNNLTCGSNLTVAGNETITGTLAVTGASTFTGQANFVNGAINVAGINNVTSIVKTQAVALVNIAAPATVAIGANIAALAPYAGVYIITAKMLSNQASRFYMGVVQIDSTGTLQNLTNIAIQGMALPSVANAAFTITPNCAGLDTLQVNMYRLSA
jgi:hypothetical protein